MHVPYKCGSIQKGNRQAFQRYKMYCREALLQRNNLPNTISVLFVLCLVVSNCRPCRLQRKTMKERDHFLSKNMVNAPECGKLHLHLSNFSGGEPPDPPPKYVPPTLKMLVTPLSPP